MKIICIGRNYAEHAKELNNPLPKEPLFFLKPDTAILREKEFYHPSFTQNIHYELEVVIRIHKVGKHIKKQFAKNYYNEISLGVDLTARDIQQKCKDLGHPWELAKGFDFSAPISRTFYHKNKYDNINNLNFRLYKNGKLVQDGNTSNMIFDFDEIIAYVSQYMTLKKGDLIFTGTPKGVGKIEIGDNFEAYLQNEKIIDLKIK